MKVDRTLFHLIVFLSAERSPLPFDDRIRLLSRITEEETLVAKNARMQLPAEFMPIFDYHFVKISLGRVAKRSGWFFLREFSETGRNPFLDARLT